MSAPPLAILISSAQAEAAAADQIAATTSLVRGLPTTALIDWSQSMVGRAIGPREWDSKEGRAYIQAMLGEPP